MRRLGTAVLIAACVVTGLSVAKAGNPRGRTVPTAQEKIARCAGAGVAEIRLPGAASVDGFRVDLGPAAQGLTRVRVQAGASERVLHVWGGGARSLRFAPALDGDVFVVSVDGATTCLERVTLFDDRAAIAVVEP